jgi:hypothetical protein
MSLGAASTTGNMPEATCVCARDPLGLSSLRTGVAEAPIWLACGA